VFSQVASIQASQITMLCLCNRVSHRCVQVFSQVASIQASQCSASATVSHRCVQVLMQHDKEMTISSTLS